MKHLITLLAALCISMAALRAQTQTAPNTSVLTLFAKDGEKFFLVLDGERKNAKAAARVSVANLDRAYYKAKIIFEDDKLGAFDDNVQLEGVDSRYNDVTYQIRKKKKGDRMVYVMNGYSFILLKGAEGTAQQTDGGSNAQSATDQTTTTTNMTQTETMPGGNLDMNVNMQGGENGMNTTTTVTTPDGETVNLGMNMNVSGMEGMNSTTTSGMNTNTTVTTTKTTKTTRSGTPIAPAQTGPSKSSKTTTTTTQRQVPAPVAEANAGKCVYPMNKAAFDKQLLSLQKTSFEDTRKNMAKLMIKNNCLSTSQVRQVIKTMSFEATKLEFAKAAYARCTDKDSYMEVADDFSFDTSKDELIAEMGK